MSVLVIDNISPNKKPIKSTLTQVINDKAINPSAIDECAKRPSKVSEESFCAL